MKKLISLLIIIPFFSLSQNTYVPDDNFEQRLITLGYDNVLDDSVVTANINTVTSLYVHSQNISDLTGIEDFVALQILYCYDNQLSSLDLTYNISLLYFLAAQNPITCIEVWDVTPFTNGTIFTDVDPGVSFFSNNFPASNITTCDSYTWNNMTYTSSGTYTWEGTNTSGCDSTATLNLTINNSYLTVDTQVHCDSYTWIDGVSYTSTDTTSQYPLQTVDNCDSTIYLHLTINQSTTSSISLTECNSYTWYDSTYTISGTYTNVNTNTAGCTHTDTLHLIIPEIVTEVIQSGDTLFANIGGSTGGTDQYKIDWYNIQGATGNSSIYLMDTNSYSFMPRFNCSYYFTVTDSNECVYSSSHFHYSLLANEIQSMNVFPNPTSNYLKVTFNNPKSQLVKLSLMNNNGKMIDQFITQGGELDINISQYPAGTYYINFTSNKQQTTNKIILNK